jgi:hypothetical protein
VDTTPPANNAPPPGDFTRPELWFAYQGQLLYQPDASDDNFYEGARLGFTRTPASDFEYTVSLGGGWKLWPETFIYELGTGLTENMRNDLIIDVQSKLSGLWGFFTAWKLTSQVQYVYSQANRFLTTTTPNQINGRSEDKVSLLLSSELTWNPTRNFAFDLSFSGQPQFYLYREALDNNGELLGEKLWLVYLGGEIRLDWTPDNRFYLVLAGEGGINLANDPAEKNWFIKINGGVELSF